MRVEAGHTDAIPLLAGDVRFAVKRCEWACEMQTQTTKRDSCMDVSAHQCAVLEMKEVLSLRLPGFFSVRFATSGQRS
jgi:hypothetical protein